MLTDNMSGTFRTAQRLRLSWEISHEPENFQRCGERARTVADVHGQRRLTLSAAAARDPTCANLDRTGADDEWPVKLADQGRAILPRMRGFAQESVADQKSMNPAHKLPAKRRARENAPAHSGWNLSATVVGFDENGHCALT
jgi:hypothetical protein